MGIITKNERKYLLTTVQTPASTWAQVPAKTSTIPAANRATVSRREANAVKNLHGRRGRYTANVPRQIESGIEDRLVEDCLHARLIHYRTPSPPNLIDSTNVSKLP